MRAGEGQIDAEGVVVSAEDDSGAVGLEGQPLVKFAYGLGFLFDGFIDAEVAEVVAYIAGGRMVEPGGGVVQIRACRRSVRCAGVGWGRRRQRMRGYRLQW